MDRWRGYLEDGLCRMRSAGRLRADADPHELALATFASLHGGLSLTPMMASIEPLDAALSALELEEGYLTDWPPSSALRRPRRTDGAAQASAPGLARGR